MKFAIITLFSLFAVSLGDSVRLGGRRDSPMEEEIVEEIAVPATEQICCTCPDIPVGSTEEDICRITEAMDQDCDSICAEDGEVAPIPHYNDRNLQQYNNDRNLQYFSAYPFNYKPLPPAPTPPPTPDYCDGPSTKRRRNLQYSGAHPAGRRCAKKGVPVCYGAIQFRDCDLSRVRWIPEDDGDGGNSMPPHPRPANDKWYHSDGLCFQGYTNWWKVPNYCQVIFDCKGAKLEIIPGTKLNGGWRFSVEPKIECLWGFSCLSAISGKSVPSPQWQLDHVLDNGMKWPDCSNTANWL